MHAHACVSVRKRAFACVCVRMHATHTPHTRHAHATHTPHTRLTHATHNASHTPHTRLTHATHTPHARHLRPEQHSIRPRHGETSENKSKKYKRAFRSRCHDRFHFEPFGPPFGSIFDPFWFSLGSIWRPWRVPGGWPQNVNEKL